MNLLLKKPTNNWIHFYALFKLTLLMFASTLGSYWCRRLFIRHNILHTLYSHHFLGHLNWKKQNDFKKFLFLGKNGQPFPLSVDIEGCDEPPCTVIKGTTAIMYVHILGSKLKTKIYRESALTEIICKILPFFFRQGQYTDLNH